MPDLKRVILLLETSRAFGREILNGIARYSRMRGPWSFYREPGGLKSSIPKLTKWNSDGIIMRNSVITGELLNLKLPTILVLHNSRRPPHIPAVITDAASISKLAAEHLINRGLKHYAFCGFDNLLWSNQRMQEFGAVLESHGFRLNVYKQNSRRKNYSWDEEQVHMIEWLHSLPKPVGVFACNDDRGQHVLEACKTAGISVPEEVAVIGVDNDSLICGLCDPPLTSIALNTESAGYAAAELLDNLMSGEKMSGQEILISATHVVRRQSTDILFVEDAQVAEAIKFIRQNAKNKLLVEDVVARTCLSRRTLEYRFRKTIHRSIQEEIRRVRIDLISQMLIETNLPIAEITSFFNFTDPEHISRYFRKTKGLGLSEFRKLNRKC